MTQVFVPSIYGEHWYGTIYYGGQWVTLVPPPSAPSPVIWPSAPAPGPPLQIPAGYSITPFTARAVDYENILVQWSEPMNSSNILDFRLLRSRYGFPIDENDGTILLDSPTGYTTSQCFDTQPIPGTMQYYGVYILLNLSGGQVWYRAGFTAVLALTDYGSAAILQSRLPEYFTMVNDTNELTTSDAFGNDYLDQFMGIFGWGQDYLQTQLALVANVNNPQVIPINYLASLAATLGFPYYSEITAGITRNALSNNAALVQQRGTTEGIEAMITQLTSWGADVHLGPNMMLEDDQADFLDPVYAPWNALISYDTGEYVTYLGYTYQSIGNNNLNTPPTGAQSNNSYWTNIYYTADSSVLANTTTGWLNTWEPLIDGMTLQHPTNAAALVEAKGIYDPIILDYVANGLSVKNNSGSTSAIELRSISRTPSDITASSTYPNRGQVIGDGIPIPYTTPQMAWNAATMYQTGTIVSYDGLPFLALKGSLNDPPPLNGVPTNEWQPIGYDGRIALMLSGYTSEPFTALPTDEQYAVTPYMIWFDEFGNFIVKMAIRTPSSGNTPSLIMFDSFGLPSTWGTNLATTTPDIGTFTWVQETGTFQVSAFGNGAVVPSTAAQTLAVVNYTSATASVGVTIAQLPTQGAWCGLVLRWSSDTSYIRSDQAAIVEVNGTAITILATHTTPFIAGDRMTATCSGNVITVFRNGTQVSTATTSFNNTQTFFGMTVDVTAATVPGQHMPEAIGQAQRRSRSRNRRRGITAGRKGV